MQLKKGAHLSKRVALCGFSLGTGEEGEEVYDDVMAELEGRIAKLSLDEPKIKKATRRTEEGKKM